MTDQLRAEYGRSQQGWSCRRKNSTNVPFSYIECSTALIGWVLASLRYVTSYILHIVNSHSAQAKVSHTVPSMRHFPIPQPMESSDCAFCTNEALYSIGVDFKVRGSRIWGGGCGFSRTLWSMGITRSPSASSKDIQPHEWHWIRKRGGENNLIDHRSQYLTLFVPGASTYLMLPTVYEITLPVSYRS